jgi:glycosyltransferase involved in cell wall biosynthesis
MSEIYNISIVVPIFNEEDNIKLLYENIMNVVSTNSYTYEIIFINDCSSDRSKIILDELSQSDENCKVIHFIRNFGQTTAMTAGIDYAIGDIIIPMDGDLQNDAEDIPKLLEKITDGYDVVSGWRKDRKDKGLTRVIPSKIANWLISKISGVKLHDYGCSLKAYRKEVVKTISLYGEMHRFIPIYAKWQGARVTEIVVTHHPRKYGISKYGINRTFKVISDLLLLKFMEKYATRPIHLFGMFGMFSLFSSFVSFILMMYFKYFGGKSFVQTPLPQLVILFFMIGILSVFMGFIAEILMRTYYESQNKKTYVLAESKNKI